MMLQSFCHFCRLCSYGLLSQSCCFLWLISVKMCEIKIQDIIRKSWTDVSKGIFCFRKFMSFSTKRCTPFCSLYHHHSCLQISCYSGYLLVVVFKENISYLIFLSSCQQFIHKTIPKTEFQPATIQKYNTHTQHGISSYSSTIHQ